MLGTTVVSSSSGRSVVVMTTGGVVVVRGASVVLLPTSAAMPSSLSRLSMLLNASSILSMALLKASKVSRLVSVATSSGEKPSPAPGKSSPTPGKPPSPGNPVLGITVVASSDLAVVVDQKTVIGLLKESTLWNCCCPFPLPEEPCDPCCGLLPGLFPVLF